MRKRIPIIALVAFQLLHIVPTFSQWGKINVPYPNCLAVNNNLLYVGGYKGFYRAARNSSAWSVDSSMNDVQINAVVANTNGVVVGTNQGFRVSKDAGQTWYLADSGFADMKVSLICANGSELFASTAAGLYLSTNFGSNWTKTLDSGLATAAIWSMTNSADTLFIGSAGGGVKRSTNKGASWSTCNNGLPKSIVWQDNGVYVSTLYASRGMLFAGIWGGDITYDDGRVYISSNGGNNWLSASFGIFNCKICRFLLNDINIFAVTSSVSNDGKVFLSTNGGAKWDQIVFSHGWINDIAVCDSIIIISAEDGLWVCPMSYIVTMVNRQSLLSPTEFALYQNYPNPFNPSTKISFSLPAKSDVKLKVYDMLGREVSTLLNEMLDVGNYEIELEGSKYPSGIYFYRMEAGSFTQTKRCLLLK